MCCNFDNLWWLKSNEFEVMTQPCVHRNFWLARILECFVMIRERLCNELTWELGFYKETKEQNKESDCTRPHDPRAKLNFSLVAICCAIKRPQPVKIDPKKASENGLCSLLSLPKKKREETNYNWWAKEVILSQAQPLVTYWRFSWA